MFILIAKLLLCKQPILVLLLLRHRRIQYFPTFRLPTAIIKCGFIWSTAQIHQLISKKLIGLFLKQNNIGIKCRMSTERCRSHVTHRAQECDYNSQKAKRLSPHQRRWLRRFSLHWIKVSQVEISLSEILWSMLCFRWPISGDHDHKHRWLVKPFGDEHSLWIGLRRKLLRTSPNSISNIKALNEKEMSVLTSQIATASRMIHTRVL